MNSFALASSKDCSSRLASNKQSAYLYLGTPPLSSDICLVMFLRV